MQYNLENRNLVSWSVFQVVIQDQYSLWKKKIIGFKNYVYQYQENNPVAQSQPNFKITLILD